MNHLTFANLRSANIKRVGLFKNKHGDLAHSEPDGSDWSLSQWSNAVAGEVGEMSEALLIAKHMGTICNITKKIDRGDFTVEQARENLGNEMADIVCHVDLLALQMDLDLGEAVRNKFNEISDRIKCNVKI